MTSAAGVGVELGSLKPRDIGDGLQAASVTEQGWLALVTSHPEHGMVELTGAAEFLETQRRDPSYVRAYRASLAQGSSPLLYYGTGCTGCTGFALHRRDGWLVQELQTALDQPVSLLFFGKLMRPPYAEITEIAPLQPVPTTQTITVDGATLTVYSPELQTRAQLRVDGAGVWARADGPEPRRWCWTGAGPVTVSGRISVDSAPDLTPLPLAEHLLETLPEDDLDPGLQSIVRGAIDYVAGCCALRVRDDEICVITDHRLLPLSWTRDAYYEVLPILLLGGPAAQRLVGDHLRWLFGSAWSYHEDLPPGESGWMRSHLTNGAVKDPGLQADQQLYPLLELAEYRNRFGHWPTPPASADVVPTQLNAWWARRVHRVLTQLPADPVTGLLASAENPADDPSQFPYLFSTQVLYGHTLRSLAAHGTELGLTNLARRAEQVWASTRELFVTTGPFGAQFAYESDLVGGARLYADANDLPTAFAPLWGFCSGQDEVWQVTMRYAFSRHNPGYSRGMFGGLGSAHTKGTWTLGEVQRLAWQRAGGADEATTWQRLAMVAAPDGLLPETFHSKTGQWFARHWFAWPGAAAAALALGYGR